MVFLKVSVLILLAISTVSADDPINGFVSDLTSLSGTTEPPSLITSITSVVVDGLSRFIQYVFELFDLKMRTIRFIASLYTDDNLQLVKKYMNVALRFGNWVYSWFPESTGEGGSRLLSYIFPEQNQPEATTPEVAPTVSPTLSEAGKENEVDLDQETREQLVTLEKLINSRFDRTAK